MSSENHYGEKHEVFISYSTKNSDIANKICYALEQNGLKCWIAPRNIPSGTVYIDAIAEAIKSTKIIVLIFSKYSQESKYVSNEINMAFSHNKPILSVNIENILPKEELEYYLKVTQWLPLSSDSEEELEKVVNDAYELCKQKKDTPVSVDLSNYKQEDLSGHKKDRISLALLAIPVLYWASFIYMGIVSAKKLWVLMGVLYAIPLLMCFLIYFQVIDLLFLLYPMFVLFLLMSFMFWIIAIIHGLVIRNEFLTRKSVLRFTSSNDEIFDYLYNEYIEL
ncbi:MAG: toll/interleukin-1 receptor domain-containing protein [Methanobrevibacter sp.]|nr:toll/interleukin-1 receptor domain-containing protein [Methanobrevibacter sp.]